ncbi:MAG: cell division protein FtsK [Propioniciclava sp.]|uniref:cell division protein FtsK n=1 Tax=Propioniciclava sp. TaxID=2038686 RepID=UPI0039E23C96
MTAHELAPAEIVEGEVVTTVDPALGPVRHPRTPQHILPGWLRSAEAASQTLRWAGWHYGRVSLYHAVRGPWYAAQLAFWAPLGFIRLLVRLILWTADADSLPAYRDAIQVASRESPGTYLRIRQERAHRVLVRILSVTAVTASVAVALVVAWWQAGDAAVVLAGGAALTVLGLAGRRSTKPLLGPVVDPSEAPRINSELIVRALGALGISELNKALRPDGEGVGFAGPIVRDGAGWRAEINLPTGVTAGAVIEKRDEMASGLRRPIDCVWLEPDHSQHAGRLVMWVADRSLAKTKPKPWPHAGGGPLSLFDPITLGWDPRGRPITATLMFVSGIIGAQPRMGKTGAVRLMLLAAAQDPRCEIHAADLKGGSDYLPLEDLATLHIGDDPETIAALAEDLRRVQADMRHRYEVIRSLPRQECPDSKVTDELASRGIGLHPLVYALDECQLAFRDPVLGKEIEEIVEDLSRRGPAAGIIMLAATQRPTSKSIPTNISANAVFRLCFRVAGQLENDVVLGTGMYKQGYRANGFTPDDKGIGYLIGGEGEAVNIVRFAYVNGVQAEEIAAKARKLRHPKPATPTPEDDVETVIDHVLAVWPAGEPAAWCDALAALLADAYPALYAGWQAAQVSTSLRPHVTVVQVKRDGVNRRGVRHSDLLLAARKAGSSTGSGRVADP